jgi:hypothetical protein
VECSVFGSGRAHVDSRQYDGGTVNRETSELLKELRTELPNAQSLSGEDRKHVEQLLHDPEEVLVPGETGAFGHDHPLYRRLRDATQLFEVSHPQLTAVMARIINSLNKYGHLSLTSPPQLRHMCATCGTVLVVRVLTEVRHGWPKSRAKSFGIDQAVAESTLHSESTLRRSGRVIPS